MSRKSTVFVLALLLAFSMPVWSAAADDVVYTRDVAPILLRSCVHCHRPGEIAPMSLLSYSETRPWAKSIQKAVTTREMPPWFADEAHGTFSNDPSLSQAEIQTINRWVMAGAPEGDPTLMPELPVFTEGWQLGEPDYIFELPTVEVPADGPDLLPNPMIRLEVPERRWVRAVEVRPSDPEVNHHQVIFMSDFRSQQANERFNILAVWAAGTAPVVFPEGTGRWVKPGDMLVVNQHYHPNGKEARTETRRVGLYFGEGEPDSVITAVLAGTMDFNIPAGESDWELRARHTMKSEADIISYFPHMHLRGKAMQFIAHYPDGKQETLIDVPGYDFDWQLFYYLQEPKRLPAGTEIEVIARYDNSANNEANPDPTRDVGFGLNSTDEMMFGVFEMIEVDQAEEAAPATGSAD